MSVPRVIARCPVCATEMERTGCPTCTALARLRATAEATGNLRERPARGYARPTRQTQEVDLPLSGQDAALPVGDR